MVLNRLDEFVVVSVVVIAVLLVLVVAVTLLLVHLCRHKNIEQKVTVFCSFLFVYLL